MSLFSKSFISGEVNKNLSFCRRLPPTSYSASSPEKRSQLVGERSKDTSFDVSYFLQIFFCKARFQRKCFSKSKCWPSNRVSIFRLLVKRSRSSLRRSGGPQYYVGGQKPLNDLRGCAGSKDFQLASDFSHTTACFSLFIHITRTILTETFPRKTRPVRVR